MVQVLKQCGDELTRENVMKQAANLKNFTTDLMLPGITVNTSPDDYFPIEQMQLMRFNGESLGVVRRRDHRRGALDVQPALSRTPARKNFCGSTASPSIRVS